MTCNPPSVSYIGHSTLLIEMDGTRVLTDPLLRKHVAHLNRQAPDPAPETYAAPDVVLISHLHLDHLDLPSLILLGRDRHVIVPAGAAALLSQRGFSRIDEMRPGESITVGQVQITATPAIHSGFRPPMGPTGEPLGFVIGGTCRIYFPGDTDIFPEMADLAGQVDVALMPVWGWGRSLGTGHLNPESAAQALPLIKPSLAIPIHWGTFATRGVRRHVPAYLVDPPHQFAEHASRLAPQVTIEILQPGDCTTIAAYCAPAGA